MTDAPQTEADALARRVAEHLLSREGTGPAWGIEIEEAREGYARIAMTVRPDMLNGHAIAHGGMIFALADTAFAYACNSRNVSTVAQAASIVFLAQAKAGDEPDADQLSPDVAKSLKWVVKLGSQSYGNPTVAGGRVYVGTNNDSPRDPKYQGDRGVLICFDEQSGMTVMSDSHSSSIS